MKLGFIVWVGFFGFAIVSGRAYAVETVPVKNLTSVSFDGKYFEATYNIVGGCQTHTGEVVIDAYSELDSFIVDVVDKTDEPDDCKSIVSVTMKIDLQARIIDFMKATGRPVGKQVDVVLPIVPVSTF